MANQVNVKAVITADDRASSVVSGFGSSFTKMAGAVAGGMAIFETLKSVTFGIAGVVTDSIKAFQEEEVAIARLRAGILNVTSARSKDVQGLLDQAAALQKVTRFSDEQVISAQGVLTTFQLNQDAISRLTPRLLDMSEGIARVSGGLPDLEGNAMLVAKAIGGEDVAGMVGALRRVGVIMTEHQTQLLTTGDMQTRLAVITQVLDQNFQGLAVSAGETTAGKMAILQNAISDLKEQFGSALATAITPFITKLTTWAQSDKARETIQQISDKIANMITQGGRWLKENWPQIKDALITFAGLAEGVARSINLIAKAIDLISGGRISKILAMKNAGATGGLSPKALGLPAFAEGVQNFGGGMAIVGERGPELVNLPRGSDVIPNGQLGGGSHVSVTIQAGVITGSQSDARKLAMLVADSLRDIAGSKNMSVQELLG